MEKNPSAKKHMNNFFEHLLNVSDELDMVSPSSEEERKTV